METAGKKGGLESFLFSLLEKGGGIQANQQNLLILIALVNLLGIIELLTQRAGAPEKKR
ncbi:MAG: hypothetical protein ACPLRH_02370 [Desulfotomaculales bacterium]